MLPFKTQPISYLASVCVPLSEAVESNMFREQFGG